MDTYRDRDRDRDGYLLAGADRLRPVYAVEPRHV